MIPVIWVHAISLLVLCWCPFLNQTLPVQQWTAYPDGSKFSASNNSCGRDGHLTSWTDYNNITNSAICNLYDCADSWKQFTSHVLETSNHQWDISTSDGHVRLATVKAGSRQYKQSIHKLVLLPVEQSETLNFSGTIYHAGNMFKFSVPCCFGWSDTCKGERKLCSFYFILLFFYYWLIYLFFVFITAC